MKGLNSQISYGVWKQIWQKPDHEINRNVCDTVWARIWVEVGSRVEGEFCA